MSADSSGQRSRDFAVKDVESMHQKRRLQSLHDAREQFFNVRRRVTELELQNQISESNADTAMRRTVEELIYQCKQLMNRKEIVDSIEKNYFQSCYLGEFPVPPGGRLPEGVNPTFNGLQSIVRAPDPIPIIFERTTREIGEPGKTTEDVVYMQIPRKPILERAYQRVEEFLDAVNLGILFDEGRPFNDWGEDFDGFE